MEHKKNPKQDLSKKTPLFLNVGLVVALAIVISAFEWKSYNDGALVDLGQPDNWEDELVIIPNTLQPPPPPPKPVAPVVIEVPDDTEVEEELMPMIDIEPEDAPVYEYSPDPEPEEIVEDVPFTVVENMPEYKGGTAAFFKYISKKIKYPSQAKRSGTEGKVFVEFVVNEKGELTKVKAIKGIGFGCDEEAVRVIASSKPWKPGKQRGKAVKVKMVLPIHFNLQ